MASVKKKIEMFQVIFKKEEGIKLSFEDVLLSETVSEYFAYVNGKDVSVRILDKGSVIIGIVETIRKDNVPPKKHRKEKNIASLGLRPGEGLAYGNVFLYEKKRQILLYEVNKFGSYVNHFLKSLENCCSEDDDWTLKFSTSLNPILKPDEYLRLQNMNYYKSLDVKFANPKAILKQLKEDKHENSALGKIVKTTTELDSDTFTGKFEVKSKRQGGRSLADLTLRGIFEDVKQLLNTKAGSLNFKRLVIHGYAVDEDENEKLEPIDLLADRYVKDIKLNEPRENTDLLEAQRSKQIKELYKKCADDLNIIFGE